MPYQSAYDTWRTEPKASPAPIGSIELEIEWTVDVKVGGATLHGIEINVTVLTFDAESWSLGPVSLRHYAKTVGQEWDLLAEETALARELRQAIHEALRADDKFAERVAERTQAAIEDEHG